MLTRINAASGNSPDTASHAPSLTTLKGKADRLSGWHLFLYRPVACHWRYIAGLKTPPPSRHMIPKA